MRKTGLKYVASDKTVFEDVSEMAKHERILIQLRLEWYNKRFSIWGEIKHFLFRIEPKKPYDF